MGTAGSSYGSASPAVYHTNCMQGHGGSEVVVCVCLRGGVVVVVGVLQ